MISDFQKRDFGMIFHPGLIASQKARKMVVVAVTRDYYFEWKQFLNHPNLKSSP